MGSELIVAKGGNNSTSSYMDPFDDDSNSISPQSPILAGHVFFADGPIDDATNWTTRNSDELDDDTSPDWNMRCSDDTANKNLDVISNNELSLDVGDSSGWETSQKVAGLSMSGFKAEKSIGNLSSLSDTTNRLMVPQSSRKVVTCTPKNRGPTSEHNGKVGVSAMNLYDAERLELEARIKVIELEKCFDSLYHQKMETEDKD